LKCVDVKGCNKGSWAEGPHKNIVARGSGELHREQVCFDRHLGFNALWNVRMDASSIESSV
jgi:hypothetical protein